MHEGDLHRQCKILTWNSGLSYLPFGGARHHINDRVREDERVTVIDHSDGRLSIRYNDVDLAYRTFDKIRHVDQAAIADNKRLGPILAMIRDEQLRRGPERRSGPSRRDQRDARLFKVG
jgi:hypothetical protein